MKKFNDSNEYISHLKVIFERPNENIFVVDCDLGENNKNYLNSINGHDVIIFQDFQLSDDANLEDTITISNDEF